jgi:hypothetical protein
MPCRRRDHSRIGDRATRWRIAFLLCVRTPGHLGVSAIEAARCQNAEMPSVSDMLWLAVMVVLMALVVVAAFWQFRRIRDGRADPVIAPDWTSLERPVPPLSEIRWGSSGQSEVEDDHVGRPFPSAGDGL